MPKISLPKFSFTRILYISCVQIIFHYSYRRCEYPWGPLARKYWARPPGKTATAGDFVVASVDYAMSHDGTSVLAVKAFREMGVTRSGTRTVSSYRSTTWCPLTTRIRPYCKGTLRQWAAAQRISHLYDVGEGICHQLVAENGFALPGKVTGGSRLALLHLRRFRGFRHRRGRDGHGRDLRLRAPVVPGAGDHQDRRRRRASRPASRPRTSSCT